MRKKTQLQLPNSVSSPQDVTALELEIHQYVRWFSHNSIKKRLHAKRQTPQPEISPAAKELLHTWSTEKPLNTQRLDELIRALQRYSDDAPAVTITLAAPAPGDLKQSLVEWCRKNISPDVLVAYEFDSTLLGGMVVRYGSHIFDWSFRRQILASADKFPEVLRRV